ncbi:Imidazolonepropionase [Saliniradius amylolyticus]|uniref:Imidazolonepropionase n=1 Tax=Saliniradius amylolyticus TaxID=2183582 RepID=A0A2S2DZ27_9ALTE|nr:imidazolonepropionase [Saliniradius amylolyticus]AWL10658.1 Imidazolonepropionase [Saliniradius amylolyticus]
MSDSVFCIVNVHLATMNPKHGAYGAIKNGALVANKGKIVWLGKERDLPADYRNIGPIDGQGQWLLPGLIDCHTHLVFGGNRADEFEQRLQGVSYADIAKAGGGIRRTVQATREASENELLSLALERAQTLIDQGVTTVEIKSGYGLDTDTELKMLKVARKVGEKLPIRVKTTFLGAHALPPEFDGNPDGYIELVCNEMLPEVAKHNLADAVDVFCESIGFSREQTQRVFEKAKALGLPVKLHAEQLSNLGGSTLAAEYQGLSVDHIEYLDEAGVKAISQSGTVATLLPGAFYFLKETQKPPVDLLRQYDVPMAIATDFNPGSSPLCQLQLMLNMACTLFALTPEEALKGVTLNAAKALGLDDQVGSLELGKAADMVLMAIDHPNQLAYNFGVNPVKSRWLRSKHLV